MVSIRKLPAAGIVACCLACPALAQGPDDVERNQEAARALEQQNLPEKFKEAEALAVDFLKGATTDDSDKLIDVAITAASLGFPPAGVALGIMKGLLFDMKTSPDPVAEALRALDRRLIAAESDIRALQASVQQLRDNDLKIENRQRLFELDNRRAEIRRLKNRLLERPQGAAARSLVDEALAEADRFLPDAEHREFMWYWSDIRVYTDPATGRLRSAMLPQRFEPDLILEAYLQSLAILVAAVRHGGYDSRLKPRIERHVAFLTENPPAHPEWPMPLPLRMQGRIGCETRVPDMQYPDRDGVCRNTIVCTEAFPDAGGHYVGQTRPFLTKAVGIRGVNLGDWCPKDMLSKVAPMIVDLGDRVGDAGIVERIEIMALAAQSLQGLGQLVNPRFDYTYSYPQYFYAVTDEGEVLEYVHEIVEDRNPPPPRDQFRERPEGRVAGGAQVDLGAAGIRERVMGPVGQSGSTSLESRSVLQDNSPALLASPPPVVRQKLVGPYPVGGGWTGYANAYSGGVYGLGAAVYGLTPAGELDWRRHDNYRGGTDNWTAPVRVGRGWNGYTRIFAAGDGVVYGIDGAGDLYWYRHLDAAATTPNAQWKGRVKVGNGWGSFVHVFATGEGVVYAVRPDGVLLWYVHRGYQTGAPDWSGPREVGTGWAHFKTIFSTGEGRIYAVQPGGELYAYHHVAYKDGGALWNPNLMLGQGFDRFAYLFPAMWGTPVFQGPR